MELRNDNQSRNNRLATKNSSNFSQSLLVMVYIDHIVWFASECDACVIDYLRHTDNSSPPNLETDSWTFVQIGSISILEIISGKSMVSFKLTRPNAFKNSIICEYLTWDWSVYTKETQVSMFTCKALTYRPILQRFETLLSVFVIFLQRFCPSYISFRFDGLVCNKFLITWFHSVECPHFSPGIEHYFDFHNIKAIDLWLAYSSFNTNVWRVDWKLSCDFLATNRYSSVFGKCSTSVSFIFILILNFKSSLILSIFLSIETEFPIFNSFSKISRQIYIQKYTMKKKKFHNEIQKLHKFSVRRATKLPQNFFSRH